MSKSASLPCLCLGVLVALQSSLFAQDAMPERPKRFLWIWLPNLEGRWKEYVDFASTWKCDGVVIWGLDGWKDKPIGPTQPGCEAFCRELVQYAHARGVQVVHGFGLNGYNEGKNVCERVPAACAQIPDRLKDTEKGKGSKGQVFCPSNPEALKVLREMLLRAADTGIDGFNFETADVDYVTCHCAACEARFKNTAETESGNKPAAWCIEQANWAIGMLKTERPNLWLNIEFAMQLFGKAPYLECEPVLQINREIDERATLVWAESTYPPQDICEKLAAGRRNIGFYVRGGEGGWPGAKHIKPADIVGAMRRLSALHPKCLFYRCWMPLDRWAVNMAVAAEAMRDGSQPDAHFAEFQKKVEDMTAPGQKYSFIEKVVPGNLASPAVERTVTCSSEDRLHGLFHLTDGAAEPGRGMWLTEKNDPKEAWAEIRWPKPCRIGLARIYHQINGHYRSLDYTIEYWDDGKWVSVEGMPIKDNQVQGWREHRFSPVTTDRLRLFITRSAYGNRMGAGELEVYEAK